MATIFRIQQEQLCNLILLQTNLYMQLMQRWVAPNSAQIDRTGSGSGGKLHPPTHPDAYVHARVRVNR